jgi:hypothetical protein
MSQPLQRFSVLLHPRIMAPDERGDFVRYTDHCAAISMLEAERDAARRDRDIERRRMNMRLMPPDNQTLVAVYAGKVRQLPKQWATEDELDGI